MTADVGIGSRHSARERAMSLLYEAETKSVAGAEIVEALPIPPLEYAVALVAGVDTRRDEIDKLLSEFSKGWALDRMPALDRAVLRLAVYELLDRPETPTAVVLSEAVELAKEYSTDDSSRFVNGLLARVAREVRPE